MLLEFDEEYQQELKDALLRSTIKSGALSGFQFTLENADNPILFTAESTMNGLQ